MDRIALRECIGHACPPGRRLSSAVLQFSSAAGSPRNRTLFATTLVNTAAEYGFEGITLSWQTPGSPGIGCNEYSAADAENLLALVKVRLQDWIENPLRRRLTL